MSKLSIKEVNELVANKLLEQMEKGVNPWVKPWKTILNGKLTKSALDYFPFNFATKKMYSGINLIMLEPGFYLTYNQARDLGGNVKKGAKSSRVYKFGTFNKYLDEKEEKNIKDKYPDEWQNIIKQDKHGKKYIVLPYVDYFNVFKLEDCENIKGADTFKPSEDDKEEIQEKPENIEIDIKRYLSLSGVTYEETASNKAYFAPLKKLVHVPLLAQFETINAYYQVKFHELTHSTTTILKRSSVKSTLERFGSNEYSKEELVAEVGSAMLLSYYGLYNDALLKNNASYLKGWASQIRGNDSLKEKMRKATIDAQNAMWLITQGETPEKRYKDEEGA